MNYSLKALFCLLLCAGLMGCSGASAIPTPSPQASVAPAAIPSNWQKIDIEQKFSFYLPPEFKEVKVQGEDSLVRQYKSETANLNLDYGGFSDPLTGYADKPGYKEQTLTIDGYAAKSISYGTAGAYVAAVHFAQAGPPKGVKLTVWIEGTQNLAELGRQIFKTIDFK